MSPVEMLKYFATVAYNGRSFPQWKVLPCVDSIFPVVHLTFTFVIYTCSTQHT